MRPSEEPLCTALVSEIYETADTVEETGELLQRCLTDSMGAKARVAQAKSQIEKIQEKLRSIEGRIEGLLNRMEKCPHPSEAHRFESDTVWCCDWCGSLWNGLQWDDHTRKGE